jgi:hypothetical protein
MKAQNYSHRELEVFLHTPKDYLTESQYSGLKTYLKTKKRSGFGTFMDDLKKQKVFPSVDVTSVDFIDLESGKEIQKHIVFAKYKSFSKINTQQKCAEFGMKMIPYDGSNYPELINKIKEN